MQCQSNHFQKINAASPLTANKNKEKNVEIIVSKSIIEKAKNKIYENFLIEIKTSTKFVKNFK